MSTTPKEGADDAAQFDPDSLDRQFDAIASSVDGEAKSDARTSEHAWKADLDKEQLVQTVKKLKAELKDLRSTRRMRKRYAQRAIDLAQTAVWFWICMFVAVAIGNAASGQPILTDRGLVTLTAGATVNVLAAFIAITRGLFNPPKP